jgi:hypothetical protein
MSHERASLPKEWSEGEFLVRFPGHLQLISGLPIW